MLIFNGSLGLSNAPVSSRLSPMYKTVECTRQWSALNIGELGPIAVREWINRSRTQSSHMWPQMKRTWNHCDAIWLQNWAILPKQEKQTLSLSLSLSLLITCIFLFKIILFKALNKTI